MPMQFASHMKRARVTCALKFTFHGDFARALAGASACCHPRIAGAVLRPTTHRTARRSTGSAITERDLRDTAVDIARRGRSRFKFLRAAHAAAGRQASEAPAAGHDASCHPSRAPGGEPLNCPESIVADVEAELIYIERDVPRLHGLRHLLRARLHIVAAGVGMVERILH